jgi:hypothetical protein
MTSVISFQIWNRELDELPSASTVPTENPSINLLERNLVLKTLQTLPTLRSSDVLEGPAEVLRFRKSQLPAFLHTLVNCLLHTAVSS